MEQTIIIEQFERPCTIREMEGSCLVRLRNAIFCLDCHCIHLGVQCPNCCSLNSVRLVELVFSHGDATDEELENLVAERLRV